MRVFLHSIGCRLNQSEVETMARQLMAAGHEIVADSALADTVIINSCAVTAGAAADARALSRRIGRQNGDAEIVLTGCYATIAPEELQELPEVGRVVANSEKDRLVKMIDPQAKADLLHYEVEPIMRDFLQRETGRTRAFVKVQDGCDNRCTFCVTTIARGRGVSRPLGDVVSEIQAMAAAGYQEAVLTGVHLGSYGRDLQQTSQESVFLGDLVTAVLYHTDIPRLRLSSLEPWDLTPRFFDLWQDARLLPHLHMPLQSGSDKILKSMARRTNRASFRQLAEAARQRIPDLNLSTDIIVGFPGESESDFQESLAYVEEMGFARLHVFSYSRRPGTAAARMAGQVPNAVKKERAKRMIASGKVLSLSFHRRYEGEMREVLWEGAVGSATENGEARWLGYTDNYIRVSTDSADALANRVTPAHLYGAHEEGLLASVDFPEQVEPSTN